MWFTNRTDVLRGIGAFGAHACSYTAPRADTDEHIREWLRTRCDCKYGLEAVQRVLGGEQTGCPELRSAYLVLSAMDDEEWQSLQARALRGMTV